MFNIIEEAIVDLKQGKLILVCDNEDRENEGDLVGLADKVTPEMINFMITHGKGLVCCPISSKIANRLNLSPMVNKNQDSLQTAFTQSIDHKSSTTGISAYERSETIRAMTLETSSKDDFNAPGHVFPLIAKDGGVLVRPGHTEATIDLARLAGASEAGIICEVINPDGTMSRVNDLKILAKQHDLKLIHIKDLILYRKKHEQFLDFISSAKLPTKFGEFVMYGFQSKIDKQEVVVLVNGDINKMVNPLVRIHSECLTGDGFASLRCDCGEQLEKSLQILAQQTGILIYLRQEGRGIGLLNKIKAYNLQDQGMDTVEANISLGFADDARDYFLAAHVLRYFKINNITLLSNNPLKFKGLEDYGVNIVARKELIIEANASNKSYLQTKVSKMGHLL